MKPKLYLILTILTLFSSCSKDEPIVEPPKESPKVETLIYEDLSHETATIVGKIISQGSSLIIEQGFYYVEEGTSPEVKVIVQNNGVGTYKADLSQLKPNTTYLYYAYAVNSIGIGKSVNKHAFITEKDPRYSGENIVLKTQAEVDDFAKREMISISNLILGEKSTKNDIKDISKLNTLEGVNDLFILNTQLTSLKGLENLKSIGVDTLAIIDNDNLELIDNLGNARIGINSSVAIEDVIIKNNKKLLKITSFGSSLSNIHRLKIDNNASLTSIEGLKDIETIYDNLNNQKFGDLSIRNNKSLITLNGLQGLKKVKNIGVINNQSLQSLEGLSSSINAPEDLTILITHSPNLSSINSLDNYTQLKYLTLNDLPNLQSLSGVKNLIEISGLDLKINSSHISNLDDLSNLKSVKNISILGTYYIYDIYRNVDEPSNVFNNYIKNIDGINNLESLDQIDVNFNLGLTHLPSFSKITQVNFITIYANNSLSKVNGFNNITKIEAKLVIGKNSNITSVTGFNSLKNAEEIYITNNENLLNIVDFSLLEEVKDFKITLNDKLNTINGFEKLKTINNDFIFIGNESLISITKMTNIETVKGSLTIHGRKYNNTSQTWVNYNDKVEDLTWLSNLKTLEGDLNVLYSSSLKNLCGLQNLLKDGTFSGAYNIQGNLFNPTKQEIIDGNCSQ